MIDTQPRQHVQVRRVRIASPLKADEVVNASRYAVRTLHGTGSD